ncbi:alpha-(1,3)-fucosyltransferase C-like [Biomphalaria glabrata]|uniref:Fucosyltransferase n=1 Tax=Biomphalaria glabrata TaxID=6526 RepID=A0A9U8EIH2_BIOGL|nr:alpha-(1,3)-fucosyltransferase C-like [Biomphalaria glabrata]XP_055865964.1 alpha-(1,3)-fucosyltransferase C-like [Biomphalaria glabrata]
MALNIRIKAFHFCIAALGLVVFIALTSKDSLLLKIKTPAAFKQLKEKLFRDPFRFDTSGSDFETSIDVNSSVQNIKDNSYSQRISLISRRENVNIPSSLKDKNKSLSCSSTTFVKCDKPTRNIIPTNTSYGIAMLRRPGWMSIPAIFDLTSCQYTNCYFQDTNINESTSVVIIYIINFDDSFKPIKRWPHQLYAALTWEAPPYTNAHLLKDGNTYWNSVFNLTATYRVDADIYVPYGDIQFQPIPVEKRPNYFEIARNKTKSVAWFVSNCNTPSRRDRYVEQMKKIIDVDIFGKCGKPCPTGDFLCSPDIPVQYRFYLSFENSFCKDYITEKFFKLYTQNTLIVPVVRGGFDYNKYLPTNTFINTADFRSARDLALYLKQLSDDPVAYSKYLENKHMYDFKKGYNLGCQTCTFLNTKKLERRIHDLKKWMTDDICHPPTDL